MVKISVQRFTYLTRVKPSLRQKTNTPIDDQMATRSLTLDFAKTTVMNWSTLSVPASLMKYILFTTRKYKIHSKNTLSELAEPSYLHLKETSHLLDQYIFISSKLINQHRRKKVHICKQEDVFPYDSPQTVSKKSQWEP